MQAVSEINCLTLEMTALDLLKKDFPVEMFSIIQKSL
jgi:hypothetical protein